MKNPGASSGVCTRPSNQELGTTKAHEPTVRGRTRGRKMITREQEKLVKNVLDCAYEVHSFLGQDTREYLSNLFTA
jgi:hypothetical protein